MKSRVANAALLIASALICLLIAEFMVRVAAPRDLSGIPITYTDEGLVVNKDGGSVRHQLGDRIVHYQFYPFHIRGAEVDKDKAQAHVVVVGESFTFGWLLHYRNSYVGLMQQYADEELHGEVKFLNAATRGWGTADYVAFLEDYGPSIDPDMVLVFLNTDDIGRSVKSDVYATVSEDPVRLRRQKVDVSVFATLNASSFSNIVRENFHLWSLVRAAVNTLILPTQEPSRPKRTNIGVHAPTTFLDTEAETREAVRLGQTLFLRLRAWCRQYGAKLVVVTTGWHEPPYDSELNEATRAFMAQAEDFFASNGISYFDASHRVAPVRTANPSRFSIPGDGHPNEAGARMIADCTWPFIRQRLYEILDYKPSMIAAGRPSRKAASTTRESTCPSSTDAAALH